MHPIWNIIALLIIIITLPAILRLVEQPIDWSRYSIPHHIARLIRRAKTRKPQPGHVHTWHRIETCKCGAVHTTRETSTP